MWHRYIGIWGCIVLWVGLQVWACSGQRPSTEAGNGDPGQESAGHKEAGALSDGSASLESTVDTQVSMDGGGLADASDSRDSSSSGADQAPEQSVVESSTPESSTLPEWVQGQPVQATPGKWTWVQVPGSKCGFGSETGFALNPSPENSRMLYIYLQGGGACWNRNNAVGGCFNLAPTALYLTGFNEQTFKLDVATQAVIKGFFFRRDTPANVFHKAHFVFLPYCSGDVFAGNSTLKSLLGRTMHFHGHNNLKLFLSRIVPTFSSVTRVVVAGSSAGGFGTALNWGLFQQAFGSSVRVDIIDDSGPPMEPIKGRWEEWMQAWKPSTPPGCTDCKSIAGIMEHYKKTLMVRGNKMAFLSYDRDSVIRTFFGLIGNLGLEFKSRLTGLLDEFDKIPHANYFILPGALHTMMIVGADNIKHSSKVTLPQWIEWMVKEDPSWKSLRP